VVPDDDPTLLAARDELDQLGRRLPPRHLKRRRHQAGDRPTEPRLSSVMI
jgi:hypothetical protein